MYKSAVRNNKILLREDETIDFKIHFIVSVAMYVCGLLCIDEKRMRCSDWGFRFLWQDLAWGDTPRNSQKSISAALSSAKILHLWLTVLGNKIIRILWNKTVNSKNTSDIHKTNNTTVSTFADNSVTSTIGNNEEKGHT